MRHHTFKYIILLFIINAFNVHAITANEILTKAANKYQEVGGIKSEFTISGINNKANGSISILGNKFYMTTPQLSIWYDGHTQWTYSSETNEVNITEPTMEELQQVNPFAIINSFKEQYNASFLKSGQNIFRIQLKPLNSNNTPINRAIISLNTTDLYPSEIILTLENNNIITINIHNIKEQKSIPASTFTFDKKKYPNTEIIDLR